MDVASLCAAVRRGETPHFLFFWGHRSRRDGSIGSGCFSQWYEAPFTIDGQRYATAEHWMMAGKARLFGDDAALARILAASTPAEAKAIGRTVRGFDGPAWDAFGFDHVVAGNVAKFGQDDALRAYLLGTGGQVLVEASPTDTVWGIGLAATDPAAAAPHRWRGRNLLGFALMEARARLR